ncbi:MAG TPA: glutamine synthetase family protein [Micromonosporaceae bacterium]|nr:glutamine synthetase family protein [Micromonosporaceae bacterium]
MGLPDAGGRAFSLLLGAAALNGFSCGAKPRLDDNALVATRDGSGADRHELAELARGRAEELADAGVVAVALTWVDNVGVTRVKAVPVARLEQAVTAGVGMSTVHDVFQVDDSITMSHYIGGPVGDLRLRPDLGALTILSAQPGWAWAPADRFTLDGRPYPPDQRTFARRMAHVAAKAGIALRMGFELEWYLANPDGTPAASGPAYGMTRLMEVADYGRDLLTALAAQRVPVLQYHPEYGVSQFELSTAPDDPVAAADRLILTRETVRAVSLRHGFRASFAPAPVADSVGNGMHLHVSVLDADGRNLFVDGPGPHGVTEVGESVLADLLARLPALGTIGAPSVASHLRSVPQRWAGAYHCWGVQNREAGLRFVTSSAGAGAAAPNVELKCVDASANPYLMVGAVCAVAAHGTSAGLRLPPAVDVDPVSLPVEARPNRLPETVSAGMTALFDDALLIAAIGAELADAFRAVHVADAEWAAGRSVHDIAAATRWRY